MTAPKVPVLSREDALAVVEYAANRASTLEACARVSARNGDALCAKQYEGESRGMRKLSIALANAARKGE